jgi:hypothetical protein
VAGRGELVSHEPIAELGILSKLKLERRTQAAVLASKLLG